MDFLEGGELQAGKPNIGLYSSLSALAKTISDMFSTETIHRLEKSPMGEKEPSTK